MFAILTASSALYKVVLYKSALLYDDLVSVTLGGKCFVGQQQIRCETLKLGADTL